MTPKVIVVRTRQGVRLQFPERSLTATGSLPASREVDAEKGTAFGRLVADLGAPANFRVR